MHRPPAQLKEGVRPDHGTTTSPPELWPHTSPLARAEELTRKRYNNFDRYGGGSGTSHGGGAGRYDHRNDNHHNRSDHYGGYRGDRNVGHRPDHNRDHHRPEYGHHYRDQQHFQRQTDGWGQASHYTYGESRKRRSNDDNYTDWSHRPSHKVELRVENKDPRLEHKDPRLEHKDPRLEHKEHPCDPRLEHLDPRLDHKWHLGQPPPPGELNFMKH